MNVTPSDPLSRVAAALREQASPIPTPTQTPGGRTPGRRTPGTMSATKRTPIPIRTLNGNSSVKKSHNRNTNTNTNRSTGNKNNHKSSISKSISNPSPYVNEYEDSSRSSNILYSHFTNEATSVTKSTLAPTDENTTDFIDMDNDNDHTSSNNNNNSILVKTPTPKRKLLSSTSKSKYSIPYYSSSNKVQQRTPKQKSTSKSKSNTYNHKTNNVLFSPNSHERQNILKKFDNEYKQSLLDVEIGTKARQESVRNIMIFTIILFAFYLIIGCCYYSIWDVDSHWPIEESLIFLIYTVTTVGYGNHSIPTSPGSRVFTMFIILIGIALVTVFFSEIFQYIVIKAARAQYAHDEEKITLRGQKVIQLFDNANSFDDSHGDDDYDDDGVVGSGDMGDRRSDLENQRKCYPHSLRALDISERRAGRVARSLVFDTYSGVKSVMNNTVVGRYLILLLPFILLLLLGSVVVGCIEGWSAIDSLYWAVVTLTTVGYGDLTPSKPASIWFSIFYLPTATIFLSLFLSNVASAYIQLHISQVMRIEKRLKNKHANADSEGDIDESLMLVKENPSGETEGSSPEQYTPQAEVITTPDRNTMLMNSRKLSMRHVLATAKKTERKRLPQDATPTPPLSLRARVQERLAYIVSSELCKKEPSVEIKGSDVTLTFSEWKAASERWMLPKKAREAFKAVSCEIILSIGTNSIRQHGVNALFDLDPNEFQKLLNPLTFAMGTAECMEAWILSTDPLIEKGRY